VKSVEFTQKTIKVGRNRNISEDIEVINEKDTSNIFFKNKKSVSRSHCEIFVEEFQWNVRDLGSRNGTFLNNKKLKPKEAFPLRDKDILSLGSNVCLCIELEEDSTDFEIDENKDDATDIDIFRKPLPEKEDERTRTKVNKIFYLEALTNEYKGYAFKIDFSNQDSIELLRLLDMNSSSKINLIFQGSTITLENRDNFDIRINNRDIQGSKAIYDGNLIDIKDYRFIFVERTSRTIMPKDYKKKEERIEKRPNKKGKTEIIIIPSDYDDSPLGLKQNSSLHNGQYIIIKQLGQVGGFGITYLADDVRLNTKVAIKEYFPRMYASRDRRDTITPITTKEANDSFKWGYNAFKKEAQTIANLPRHKNIIDVKNLFEENGTVYYVMEYTEGEDLESYLKHKRPLNEKDIRDIITPLLNGVKHIHKYDILHRDIKLSNILISDIGEPILIDFGTARNKLIQRSKKLTTVYTEGFAALEQHTGGNEGTYTDIYAIGMVIYALINGITDTERLPSAVKRLDNTDESLLKFPKSGKRFSKGFLKVVEKMVKVKHKNRPQNIDEVIKLLDNSKKNLSSYIFIGISTVILIIGIAIILNLN
jgi:hypothetical protein